jgi:hypothetical protein
VALPEIEREEWPEQIELRDRIEQLLDGPKRL